MEDGYQRISLETSDVLAMLSKNYREKEIDPLNLGYLCNEIDPSTEISLKKGVVEIRLQNGAIVILPKKYGIAAYEKPIGVNELFPRFEANQTLWNLNKALNNYGKKEVQNYGK